MIKKNRGEGGGRKSTHEKMLKKHLSIVSHLSHSLSISLSMCVSAFGGYRQLVRHRIILLSHHNFKLGQFCTQAVMVVVLLLMELENPTVCAKRESDRLRFALSWLLGGMIYLY